MALNELTAVSPVDGRYREKVKELEDFFSEFALIRNRIKIEIEYLIFLSKYGVIKKLDAEQEKILRDIYLKFTLSDAKEVKEIEEKTRHDVKAMEYFIRRRIAETSVADLASKIHIGLTSDDVNNIAYALSVKHFLEQFLIKELELLRDKLMALAQDNKRVVMLARTHGQPAVPTTFGKEFLVFASRLDRQISQLKKMKILAKINGAVGNYNAHVAAFSNIDWIKFSEEFICSLGLEANLITTQIEPYDSLAEVFHNLIRVNNIILNLDRDMWTYISMDYLKQKPRKGEISSSTMPQKVNPIDFENSEGNLGVSNALLDHLSNKLPVSRLQRDLSDTTVRRNIGVAFAHAIIAYRNTLEGLNRIEVDEKTIKEDLKSHPEVVSEGIQTILRREGVEQAYEKLMDLTRGKKLTRNDIETFIKGLDVNQKVKNELLQLSEENYIGLAEKLCDLFITNEKGIKKEPLASEIVEINDRYLQKEFFKYTG